MNTFRIGFTAASTLFVWGILALEHSRGGIVSHNILADPNLPAISNLWGALTIPLLTFFLVSRAMRRYSRKSASAQALAFIGSLLYGAALATAFANGNTDIPSFMVLSVPLIALVLPTYRAEYVLGFVLGLVYTFGGVLPIGIATVLALMSVVMHQGVRRGVLWIIAKTR
jgi:hypothetical protein